MKRRKFLKTAALSCLALAVEGKSGKAKIPEIAHQGTEGDQDKLEFFPFVQHREEDPMSVWKAARDSSQSRVVNVLFIGDSITYGTNIPYAQTNGFVGLIRKDLQSEYGDTGIGLVPAFNTDQAIKWEPGSIGTWERSSYGIMKAGKKGNGGDETLSFTSVCDHFDLQYIMDGTTKSFTCSLDGGAVQTIGGAGSLKQYITRINCGTQGSHTVVLTSPLDGDCHIDAIYANRGTTGIRVHNAGRDGGTVSAANHNASSLSYIDLLQPRLSVIGLTVNDYNGQTDMDFYKNSLQTIIEKCSAYGSVLVIGSNPCNSIKSIPQSEYNNAARIVADKCGTAFLDMFSRWGTYGRAVSMGFMSPYDPFHPTINGHADYKAAIMDVIQ